MDPAQPHRPVVALPCPASEIEGREIDFIPIHDGIDEAVRGTIHVVSLDQGCSVAANYTAPALDATYEPTVYWLDQAEVEALFKR